MDGAYGSFHPLTQALGLAVYSGYEDQGCGHLSRHCLPPSSRCCVTVPFTCKLGGDPLSQGVETWPSARSTRVLIHATHCPFL